MALATIARPLDSTGTSFDLNTTPFSISSTVADVDLIAGTTLSKVGSTTGWTYGTIAATCQTMQPPDHPGHYLICNYSGDMTDSYGDSGSPVFIHATDGSAKLAGLLWGSGGAFASFEGLEYDLGTLYPL